LEALHDVKNRLKVLRAERDWTQEDLARELGISRQAVIAIEKEKYDPSLPLAFRISRLFGKPVEEIFKFEG
jgi:putative transcriptional regulator